MLFIVLGKAKGAVEIQTVKPILTITPPPEPCNTSSINIPFDVLSDCSGREGDKKLIHQFIWNFQSTTA